MKRIVLSLAAVFTLCTGLLTSCLREGYEQNAITMGDTILGFGTKVAASVAHYGNGAPVFSAPKGWDISFNDEYSLLMFTMPDYSDSVTLSGNVTYQSTDGKNSLSLTIPMYVGYKNTVVKSLDQVICFETADSTIFASLDSLDSKAFGPELVDTAYLNKGYIVFNETVKVIPSNVFAGQTMEILHLPSSLSKICNGAFCGIQSTNGAAKIFFKGLVAPAFETADCEDQFTGSKLEIHIPQGTLATYKAAFEEKLAKADSYCFVEG